MAATTTPFVAPLGFTQPGEIPVAHTEGAVALDLTAFIPDIVSQILRAQNGGVYTRDGLAKDVVRAGYASVHISCETADRLLFSLGAAIADAEEVGSNG